MFICGGCYHLYDTERGLHSHYHKAKNPACKAQKEDVESFLSAVSSNLQDLPKDQDMFGNYKPEDFEGQHAAWLESSRLSKSMIIDDDEEQQEDMMEIDEVPPLIADTDHEDIGLIDEDIELMNEGIDLNAKIDVDKEVELIV